ncbi:MAG: BMP family ABC transporter substrate-binding protein [Eubacterium sp.]|nr:BMP family ABC transporter substrate-binding protein [Eubacterium sp.]
MDISVYERMYKLGMKEYRNKTLKGEWPYLWVLDAILSHVEVAKEEELGLVDIPLDQIRGTKTEGRTNAFAANFMPLLPSDSEFAYKWAQLYESHLEEGIHEPIKAYEFLNQFYVLEGNKRVSVLKACDAVSVPGTVTRIIPKKDDSDENKIYYEFLDFYDITSVNYINFSQVGSYPGLLQKIGVASAEDFTEEVRQQFSSAYIKFSTVFKKKGGEKLSLTIADAFLLYLDLHSYEEMEEKSTDEIAKEIDKIWSDFVYYPNKPEVKLIFDAEPVSTRPNLVKKILPITTSSTPVKVAFIHSKTVETSSWTYGHDLGANHLEEALDYKVEVSSYFGADTQEREMECFEQAIVDGNTIIFSTSSKLVGTSMKYALDYPKLHFLNCSLNTNSKYVRTYYGRLYEAKFLIGALAGVLAPTDTIGYLADYPIYGGIANINAFALGAKMVNPEIKVYVKWAHLNSDRQNELLRDVDVSLVSGRDFIRPESDSQKFGLYDPHEEIPDSLAMPVWDWGVYYEKTVSSILNGSWKQEADGEYEALNDWWGISSGMIDVICSKKLPPDTVRLINLLKKGIGSGEFDPFAGRRYTKDGTHYIKVTDRLTAEQIITMDWLAENVIGFIPTMEELTEDAKTIVRIQGVSSVTKED